MNTVLIVLLVINLLLSVTTLVWVTVRPRTEQQDTSEVAAVLRDEFRVLNSEIRQDFATQRGELVHTVTVAQQQIESRVHAMGTSQAQSFTHEREARATANRELRELLDRSLNEQLATTLKTSLEENAQRIRILTESNSEKQLELRKSLQEELEKLRQGNEAKLEKMRETVDEKLQGTLEKRLGESFSLVSERLEQVQKGLGEMQTLASDVGGLKRVLTNVKSRGSWGEVQLARQLEDMLTADQYDINVAIRPDSNDRVEFAVKLPGRETEDRPVYLPIDSKFPQEDYERLLEAQESGEKLDSDQASKNVEKVILEQAKLISQKYIDPPHSTDFAIMYLPTEGLFAEVVRRPGLASKLQNEHRILITGPTTLMSLLNSLQMGFRTLAIEQRSSEVWQVLSAAKLEFSKYGAVMDKLKKQLNTAQNTVEEAGIRTRAVERKLRSVESLDPGSSEANLLEDVLDDFEDTDHSETAE